MLNKIQRKTLRQSAFFNKTAGLKANGSVSHSLETFVLKTQTNDGKLYVATINTFYYYQMH